MTKEEGAVEKCTDSDGYDASNTRNRRRHEKWIFRHGRRMFRRGSLDGISLMEQGGAQVRTRPYYFTRISVPQKNCGRPPIYPSEFVREGIKNIPLRKCEHKESWRHRWGCQRRLCNVGLLIRLFKFIATP